MTDEELVDANYAAGMRYFEAIVRGRAEMLPIWARRAESPIERRLLAELIYVQCPLYFGGNDMPVPLLSPDALPPISDIKELPAAVDGRPRDSASLYMQTQVAGYRVDFLLVVKLEEGDRIIGLVIECDGHDFHERTKEQAQRDRGMDRALTAAGFKVMRFTGSEIFRDAKKCASGLAEFLSTEEYRTRPE